MKVSARFSILDGIWPLTWARLFFVQSLQADIDVQPSNDDCSSWQFFFAFKFLIVTNGFSLQD